ncbi:MAG: hypothetical protein ACR2G6_13880 [Gemmatimonadaceae bacterium]
MNRIIKQGIIAVTAAAVACGDPTRAFNEQRLKSERVVTHKGRSHRIIREGGRFRHYIDGKLFAEQVGSSLIVRSGGKVLQFAVPRVPGERPILQLGALFVPKSAEAQSWSACFKETLAVAASAAVLVSAISAAAGAEVATAGLATPGVVMAVAGAITVYTGAVYSYATCIREEQARESLQEG